jgi:hypothetical protein
MQLRRRHTDKAAEKAFPPSRLISPYAATSDPAALGDTHTHTRFRWTRARRPAPPKDAYRFAKGEEVIMSSGQRAKFRRWISVVTDHSTVWASSRNCWAAIRPAGDAAGRKW